MSFVRPRFISLLLVSCFTLGMISAQSPELRRSSGLVLEVQRALAEKGYDPGPVDGIMGPRTRSAIEDFQKTSSLPVDGQLDDATLNRLGVPIPARSGSDGGSGGVVGTVGRAGSTTGRAVGSAGKTAGKATAEGVTIGAKTTARGATTGAKATARGAKVVGRSTAQGASTAGRATAKGATKAAEAASTGAKKVGSGLGKAASGTRGFLFGSNELKKEVERQLKETARIQLDDVEVKVDEGVVTLRFKRGSREEWDRAIRTARSVEGVTDVVIVTP